MIRRILVLPVVGCLLISMIPLVIACAFGEWLSTKAESIGKRLDSWVMDILDWSDD